MASNRSSRNYRGHGKVYTAVDAWLENDGPTSVTLCVQTRIWGSSDGPWGYGLVGQSGWQGNGDAKWGEAGRGWTNYTKELVNGTLRWVVYKTHSGWNANCWAKSWGETYNNYYGPYGEANDVRCDQWIGAKWSYTVSYDANGGSGAPSSQTKWHGESLTLSSSIPTRSNYEFLGWSTSKNGSVEYASGAKFDTNSNITLYAIWKLSFKPPTISSFTLERCDKDGNISSTGHYIHAKAYWAVDLTTDSTNTVKRVTFDLKPKKDTNWGTQTDIYPVADEDKGISLINGYSEAILGDGTLSIVEQYNVRVTVVDQHLSNSQIGLLVPGSYGLEGVTPNFGIPKIVDLDTYIEIDPFNDAFDLIDVAGVDYVVEFGTRGEWWYRKWKSGRAECGIDYKSFGSFELNRPWTGSWYAGPRLTFGAYPFTFKSRPYTSIKFMYDRNLNEGRTCQVMEGATKSTAISPSFYVVDGTSGEFNGFFGIFVMGYYK